MGLDRSVQASGDLWILNSNRQSQQLQLDKIPDGETTPEIIATSALGSNPFTFTTTSGFDDTDIYTESIRFEFNNAGDLVDQNANAITVNPEAPLPPSYGFSIPNPQFLTTDAINAAGDNANPLLRQASNGYLYNPPIGSSTPINEEFEVFLFPGSRHSVPKHAATVRDCALDQQSGFNHQWSIWGCPQNKR